MLSLQSDPRQYNHQQQQQQQQQQQRQQQLLHQQVIRVPPLTAAAALYNGVGAGATGPIGGTSGIGRSGVVDQHQRDDLSFSLHSDSALSSVTVKSDIKQEEWIGDRT